MDLHCPIRKGDPDPDYGPREVSAECLNEKCAWFYHGGCAVPKIADEIKKIRYAINAQKKQDD
jgi:hypothetical protein